MFISSKLAQCSLPNFRHSLLPADKSHRFVLEKSSIHQKYSLPDHLLTGTGGEGAPRRPIPTPSMPKSTRFTTTPAAPGSRQLPPRPRRSTLPRLSRLTPPTYTLETLTSSSTTSSSSRRHKFRFRPSHRRSLRWSTTSTNCKRARKATSTRRRTNTRRRRRRRRRRRSTCSCRPRQVAAPSES